MQPQGQREGERRWEVQVGGVYHAKGPTVSLARDFPGGPRRLRHIEEIKGLPQGD